MSTDKLQATIAQILGEPPLISTNTVPSPPTFFDEEPAPPILSNQPNHRDPPPLGDARHQRQANEIVAC